MKKSVVFALIFLISISVGYSAIVTHSASEITSGAFGNENYTFGDSINVNNTVNASEICINGDCQSSWPSGTEIDPEVGDFNLSRVARWNGTSLEPGSILDNLTIYNGLFTIGSGHSGTGIASFAMGSYNIVDGNRAWALGNKVQANHLGSWVIGDWASDVPATTQSSADDEMTMRFAGGYRFFTSSDDLDSTQSIYFTGNSGKVGIGTATPYAKLQVSGDANFTNVSTERVDITNEDSEYGLRISGNADIILDHNTNFGSAANIYFREDNTDKAEIFWNSSNDVLAITNNENIIVVDNQGRVGINTTSPNMELTVEGDVNITGSLYTSENSVYIGDKALSNDAGTLKWGGTTVETGFPFKYYSCYISQAVNQDTWGERTWIDSDCTGDTGIPNDNTNCMVAANEFQSGGGEACNFECTKTQGRTYNCLSGQITMNIQCDYLCWN